MAKRALISGYIGFNNFGDDAIFEDVVKNLKKREIEVSALSSNPIETAKKYDIKAYKFKNPKEIIKAIWKSDILISGGGSLFQNGTSSLSLLYYAFIIILAKLFFKKVIILGQGIGPIYGRYFERISAFCFKIADMVTVRDNSSLRFLEKYKIKGKLLPDPVWSVEMPKYEPKNIVGIQMRNSNKISDLFIKNFAHFTGLHFQEKEIKIFLMQNEQDKPNSDKFLFYLKEEYPNINAEIVEYTTVEKLLQDFSHLEELIAMRFHACLLGYRLGIKTLCISYNKKVDELCKDFNMKYVELSDSINFSKELEDFSKQEESSLFEDKRKEKFDWNYFNKILGEEK